MCKSNVCKKEGNPEYQSTSQESTKYSSCDKSEDYNQIWSWWYEYFLDIFLKFRHIERRDRIHKRTRDYRHDNKSWDDEFHITSPSDRRELGPDKLPKYHIIEGSCNNRRNECLCPDTKKTSHFLTNNRPISYKKSIRWHNWTIRNKEL